MICKVVNVLLIEDNRMDQIEMARALDHKRILNRINVARNKDEALALLDHDNSAFEKPDVILVDLDLPRVDSFKFISTLKNREELNNTKVFALSESEDEAVKVKAIKSGASGLIVKPLQLENPSSIDAFNLMIDMMNMRSN